MEEVKKHYKENQHQMYGTTEEEFCRWVGMAREIYLNENATMDQLAVIGQDEEDKIMAENIEGMATRYTLERDYINEEVDPEWFLDTEEKIVTLEEWETEGNKLFGTQKSNWKFKCPSCGKVQSVQDFIGLGYSFIEAYIIASHDCYGVHNVGCGCAFKLDGDERNSSLIQVVTGSVTDRLFPFYIENIEDEED